MRKELKLDEDPWENYLIYDARYFLPLLCHKKALPLVDQIVLAYFVMLSIEDETISEYRPEGD